MATLTLEQQHTRARIRALFQGVRVWELEQGYRYVAPSCTDDGTAYELYVRDDGISCQCLGALNGRVCKHIGAVSLRLEAEAQITE